TACRCTCAPAVGTATAWARAPPAAPLSSSAPPADPSRRVYHRYWGTTIREVDMFKNLMATQPRLSPLVLRLLLGGVMFPHGAQKALGWWGGHGLNATIQGFTTHMGIPLVFAWLAVAAECLGSLGLIVGLLTRVAAFGI